MELQYARIWMQLDNTEEQEKSNYREHDKLWGSIPDFYTEVLCSNPRKLTRSFLKQKSQYKQYRET